MELNEELYDRWVRKIWPKLTAADDIIDIALVNRARSEDIEEAKRLLSEFTEQAADFLDELSESVQKETRHDN